jgi:hypothetical protein
MTVQILKLGRNKFVLLREKDYRSLERRAKGAKTRGQRRLTAQDRGDIAEAMRRLNDPDQKPIPYQQVRKELGF